MATGSCAYTTAGKLSSKYVIHAVGPVYDDGEAEQCHEDLKNCLINTCNMAANELKIASVSLPAISSGIFGFPKEKCSEILLDNAIEWSSKQDANCTLKTIRLCNFDEPTVNTFKETFNKKFANWGDSKRKSVVRAGSALAHEAILVKR